VLTIPFISKERRKYFIVLILAIILFYFQSSVRSDWKLWAWYFYPIPAVSFVIAGETFKRANFPAGFVAAFGFILGLFLISLYAFPFTFIGSNLQGKIDILHIAGFRIKDFEKEHKGIYAMGDRAGIAGYLIKSPLIQLEGLVMDKEYLTHLRKSSKMYEVLQKYKVDYYIASNARKLNDSTYVVSEPIQSNGYSKKIIDTIHWKVEDQFRLIMPGLLFKNSFEASETTIFKVPKNESISHLKL
jgi:hypothetical protein